MKRPRKLLLLVPFLLPVLSAFGSTSDDERWERFIAGHTGRNAIAEDAKMGVLADLRKPDPEWEKAIEVCESVFSALENGRIPSDLFDPATRGSLAFAFGNVLSAGPRESDRRYGLPDREGGRMTVPIRIAGGDQPVYGHVYMLLLDGVWYVEQWSVDLTGLPITDGIE